MKNTSKRKTSDAKSTNSIKILKAVAFGLLVTTVMLLLFSFVLYKKSDFPFALINPLSTAALLVGAMTSGYTVAKSCREKGMLLGGACGLIIFAILLLFSTMLEFNIGAKAAIKLLISVLSGSIGGIFGINQRSRRKVKS